MGLLSARTAWAERDRCDISSSLQHGANTPLALRETALTGEFHSFVAHQPDWVHGHAKRSLPCTWRGRRLAVPAWPTRPA